MKEVWRSNWFPLEGYNAATVKYDDGSKRTVYQHREIKEKELGRKLNSKEHVHHKNGNRKDNHPKNLEVVSFSGHIKKHRKIEWTTVVCLECENKFKKMAKDERRRIRTKRNGPFCGKSCTGKWGRKEQIKKE